MHQQPQLPPNQQHQTALAAPGTACVRTGTLGPGLQSSECPSAPRQPWPDTCAAPARRRGKSCTACRRGGGKTLRTPPPSAGLAGPGTLRARPRAATPGTQWPPYHAQTLSPAQSACFEQSRLCGVSQQLHVSFLSKTTPPTLQHAPCRLRPLRMELKGEDLAMGRHGAGEAGGK